MNGKMHQGNKSKLRTMGQPIHDLPKWIRKCIERSRSHSPTNSATAIPYKRPTESQKSQTKYEQMRS